ncbi:hypothetical protein B0A48_04773 [Cryoendolithus antarcticus]|uniref:Zn(2)-C6 fungal-type domain-containing protein n=1 Tax=Cryoendolithus antarcticus TaxID=1507870 RepID=A0A1V8TDC5_9PEZI|nr:hypothetical protein B0A48_04773 [Cryoendolithus antarcticus]
MLSTTTIHHPYPDHFGYQAMAMQQQHALHPAHMSTPMMATTGLDTLAEAGSQYQMQHGVHPQQLPHPQGQQGLQNLNNAARPPMKHRLSYGAESATGGSIHGGEKKLGRSGSSGQPVRRRISRACDQCNQLRTKCDGKTPCAHCVEFGLTCEYVRERKKRGKASRKDLAAQQAANGGTDGDEGKDGSPNSVFQDNSSEDQSNDTKETPQQGIKRRRSSADLPPPRLPPNRTGSMSSQRHPGEVHPLPSMEHNGALNGHHIPDVQSMERQIPNHMPMNAQTPSMPLPTPRLPNNGMPERTMSVSMGEYSTIDDYHRSMLHAGTTVNGQNILHSGSTAMPNSMMHNGQMPGYPESQYGVPSPGSQQGMGHGHFRMGESPLSAGFMGQSPVGNSPGWLSLPSPSNGMYNHLHAGQMQQPLRYPVLRPLLQHIAAIIPITLACDLLELYFTSTSSAFMQPQSPYILGYIFRKRSFLRVTNPRQCSPALLASMLWVAAQTSESAFLTSPPSARGKICQKLLELTVGLLKPLIHRSSDSPSAYGANTVINGVALGGFGVGLPTQVQEMEGGSPGATGGLDDVATYIHLATVVSASEYKAASLRWWNAAWTLARELKLGRELPPSPEPQAQQDGADGGVEHNGEHEGMRMNEHRPINGAPPGANSPPGVISEEEREERRRIWWLLYTVDRHLALCYNRPLFLLDVECDGLLQPENDAIWQAGEYYPPENFAEISFFRRRGPSFECTGHSIFGHFLPLMTIMGEIVDLNHARNHPRFGLRFRNPSDWDDHAAEISQQLEAYGRSLKEFEARFTTAAPPEPKKPTEEHDANTPSVKSVGSHQSAQRMTESILQSKVVVAYGTHLMHTLHILLNGKWDPIALLDDNDLWISSQSFISATSHAVSAAEAINEILEYNPDLSFMPFFFGIYLLQGSFLLLLIADKLQGEASPSVVKACETIVRAHEACVVTLNTEYQRNFRKVMRSALSQVRGRIIEDFGEQQLRRREVLALYRWTGDGTGLAL